MSTLLKVAQMSGGTVALMSGGTYDSGTKVAASCDILFDTRNYYSIFY
jgi:hypothetical protein